MNIKKTDPKKLSEEEKETKWYKNKILLTFLSLIIIAFTISIILLAKYGLPDIQEAIYSRSSASSIYWSSPKFIKKQIKALSQKQRSYLWKNYASNIHVKNFTMLHPKGDFKYDAMSISGHKQLECWAFLYGRYYLTMKVRFTKNFTKTGIATYEDPKFKLIELPSITNFGNAGISSIPDGSIILWQRSGNLKLLPAETTMTFGKKTWKRLLKNSGNYTAIFPNIIKNKPLNIIYDFSDAEKAADNGDSESIKFIASAYFHGLHVPQDYKKAMKLYIKAIELYKKISYFGEDYHRAAYFVGYMYEHGKGVEIDFEKAEIWYRQTLDENIPNSYNYLAYFLAERNKDLPEAKKIIDIALAKHPNNSYFIDTLGWIYYKQGKYKDAVRELKRSNDLKPNIVVMNHLADAYTKLGEKELALQCRKEADEIRNQATQNK